VLRGELAALGRDRGVASIQRLSGGFAADAWLVSYADGSRVVGKTMAGAPADLFRLWCCPRPPASRRFFDAYQEVNPSPPGWAERMPLLHMRELLSAIACVGDSGGAYTRRIREVLAPFYPRPLA
jgi:fructosamine-3-kinase